MTFTRVGVIVVITAVAVYFGLNFLLPRNAAEQKTAAGTTPDQVFNSTTSATPAAPTQSTPAASGANPSAEQQAAAEQQPKAAATSSTTPPPAADTSAASGSSSASAPAAAAPAQGLSEEEARKIAEEVGRKVATQVASSAVQSNPQPQAAAEAAPAAAAAAAAEPSAAAEPATAAAPKPKKNKHASAATAGTAASPAKASTKSHAHAGLQSTDVITTWWPAVDKQKDSQLNLVFAGEAAFEKAAVLLFSDNIGNAATAASHIQILSSSGKPAAGQWEVSSQNARMLIFKTKPGRYTVILAPELAGLSGKTLGTSLHGPVYVH